MRFAQELPQIFQHSLYFPSMNESITQSQKPPFLTQEKAEWFIGIAETVGDALTFWILTEDTEKIIGRSVVRATEDPKTVNQ